MSEWEIYVAFVELRKQTFELARGIEEYDKDSSVVRKLDDQCSSLLDCQHQTEEFFKP